MILNHTAAAFAIANVANVNGRFAGVQGSMCPTDLMSLGQHSSLPRLSWKPDTVTDSTAERRPYGRGYQSPTIRQSSDVKRLRSHRSVKG